MISPGSRAKPPYWPVVQSATPLGLRGLWRNLQLAWPLWDWRQKQAEDVSGNRFHGTMGSGWVASRWIATDYGPALDLPASATENISLADPPSNLLDGFSKFSAEVMFIVHTLPTGTEDKGLIGKYQPIVGGRSWRFYLSAVGTVELELQVSSDGTNYEAQLTSAANIAINTVYQAVFSYNAGTFATYLNGKAVANDGNFTSQLSVYGGTAGINVGARTSSSGGNVDSLDGVILSVRIWDRVISAEEVRLLWDQPFGQYAGPWAFPEMALLHTGGAAAGPWQDAGPVSKGVKELLIGGLVNGTSYDVMCKTVDLSENTSTGCTPVAQTPVASPATVRNVREVLQTGPLGAPKILRTVRQ